MEMRINAGYTITDSIHIGKAEFVIGEMPNAPAPFVTWECKNGDNYFWGHYFKDEYSAQKDLVARGNDKVAFYDRFLKKTDKEPEHNSHDDR